MYVPEIYWSELITHLQVIITLSSERGELQVDRNPHTERPTLARILQYNGWFFTFQMEILKKIMYCSNEI